MEPVVGFEPTTDGLQNRCSTTELNWLHRSRRKRIEPAFYSPELHYGQVEQRPNPGTRLIMMALFGRVLPICPHPHQQPDAMLSRRSGSSEKNDALCMKIVSPTTRRTALLPNIRITCWWTAWAGQAAPAIALGTVLFGTQLPAAI